MRRSWTEVVCFVKGVLSFFIHCISASCRNWRICCHFTFHTGCNITVCNLSLSVPTVRLNPSRRQGRRYKLPGLGSAERVCGPYTLRVFFTFIRPALAGGTEETFYQCVTHSQRPWLLRDDFCQCVHTDITPQFRIVAIITVVDSQTLYQRNLPVFRWVSLITSLQNSCT